jgi:aromatic ring-opening dioxygenase catalytic subunit (LigB family)
VTAKARQPALFIGPGSPSLLATEQNPTRAWLQRFGAVLRATPPLGIVCVSSHFVAPSFCVTTSETPEMLRDADSENVAVDKRPPGSIALARKTIESLLFARLKATADPTRGLDHGVWLPLAFLFPDAEVPVVQVSLHSSLDPEMHFALGRALEPLRDEGILVLGSGGLTRDLADHERICRSPDVPDVLGERSRRFETWVTDLLTGSAPYARARGLTRFRDHPDARVVQPNGEYLLPLVVVAGAASKDMPHGNEGVLVHAGSQRGLSTAAFSFGP